MESSSFHFGIDNKSIIQISPVTTLEKYNPPSGWAAISCKSKQGLRVETSQERGDASGLTGTLETALLALSEDFATIKASILKGRLKR